jgi:hypothetical protein
MSTIEVRCRVAGPQRDEAELPALPLVLATARLTVRELIERTVEEQVRELTARDRLSAEQQRRALRRQYLTEDEVTRQAAAGAVRFPSKVAEASPIDPAEAVGMAVEGFERGAFLVLVDGRQADRLDAVLELGPGSRVTFLRLVPLAGG